MNSRYKEKFSCAEKRSPGLLGLFMALVFFLTFSGQAAACTVTNTNDSGAGSLRQCITTANATPGTTIAFNIPNTDPNYTNGGSGTNYWWQITPATVALPLPAISAANTVIDGTTQTTTQGNTNLLGPEIEINGATVGAGGHDGFGVVTPATGVIIKGFIINRWSGAGISLWTGTGTVTGNYIGTDYAGTAALANTLYGVYVNSNGNAIGGTTATERNVIAGNGSRGIYLVGNNNTIQGNYIGVNASASAALANTTYGIDILTTATGNTLGGTAAGAGNVISGNTSDGINHGASGTNVVQGNYIGTNASSAALPNGGNGLSTSAGTINLGNASEAQSNVIGPNTGVGINLAGGAINLAGTVTVNDDVTLSTGTLAMGSATLNVSGSWTLTSATVAPGTSTVTFNGTSGTILITPGAQSFYNITFNDAGGTATYQLQGALTVTNDLTVVDGILDTRNTFNYAITVTRDFIQSGGRTLARSSTLTVGRNFRGNATEISTGYDSATLIMTGTGTLTYSNNPTPWIRGFYDLTVGQSGNTVTLMNTLDVRNILSVGSGTITGGAGVRIFLGGVSGGSNPLSLSATSTISVDTLEFWKVGTQFLPPLPNGYDTNIGVALSGAIVTQTGDVTLNAGKSLLVDGDGFANRVATYNTNGFNLTVGGNITLGAGNDTLLKALNGSNSNITVAGNFDIKNIGTGSQQAVFTSTNSTVNLNGITSQTVRSSGSRFNHLTLNNSGGAGSNRVTVLDILNVDGALTVTNGVFDIGTNNPAINTAGNVTIGVSGSVDVTARTANWTFNGVSTLTDSSSGGPQQLNDVVLNGTSLTLGSSARMKALTITAGTMNLGAGGYTLELTGTGTPLSNSGTFSAGTSTVKYSGTTTATNIATVAYNNLQLAPTGATTYSLTGNLTGGNTLTGNLTIDANATLDATTASNYNLAAVNAALNVGSTYLAQGSTLTLSGNWSNLGAFIAGTSTLVMNGVNKSLSGNTTFNNFTKSVAVTDTLTFAAGSTTAIAAGGTFTLNGASGNLLRLRSATPTSAWLLNVDPAASTAVSYVDAQDSNASGGQTIYAYYSTDSLRNTNWVFGQQLQLVKQVWDLAGNCLASQPADAGCNGGLSAITVPAGGQVYFLIFVRNVMAVTAPDLRFQDLLNDSGFTYQAASLRRSPVDASAPADTAALATLFAAATLNQTDTFDGASQIDEFAGIDVSTSPDNLTVGGTGAAGQNDSLSLPARKTFVLKFQAVKN